MAPFLPKGPAMRLHIALIFTTFALSVQGCTEKDNDPTATTEPGAEDTSSAGGEDLTGSGTEATGVEPTTGTATDADTEDEPVTGSGTDDTSATGGMGGTDSLPEVPNPCTGCVDGEYCEYWVSSLGCGTVWDCTTIDFFNDEDDSRMDDDCAPCLAEPQACDAAFLEACTRNDDFVCGSFEVISVGMSPDGVVVVECQAPPHDCDEGDF